MAGALFSCVAALLNTLPMLLRSTSRMAISPTATSAMMRAYSTRPWPDSSREKACHNAFILPPWLGASFGFAAHQKPAEGHEVDPDMGPTTGVGWLCQPTVTHEC